MDEETRLFLMDQREEIQWEHHQADVMEALVHAAYLKGKFDGQVEAVESFVRGYHD